MRIDNLISFSGIFVLTAFAWLISSNRRNVNWRVISWGIGLQLGLALFVFTVPAGGRDKIVSPPERRGGPSHGLGLSRGQVSFWPARLAAGHFQWI